MKLSMAHRCRSSQTLDRQSPPSADGKSPNTGPEEPTLESTATAAVKNQLINLHLNSIQIRREPWSGRGETTSSDPQILELGEVTRVTEKLQGAPPQEGIHADNKTRSSSSTTSWAPPAGDLPKPTLYTRRETGFPNPPAAGTADGGGGTHASPASEVDRRPTLKNRLL